MPSLLFALFSFWFNYINNRKHVLFLHCKTPSLFQFLLDMLQSSVFADVFSADWTAEFNETGTKSHSLKNKKINIIWI